MVRSIASRNFQVSIFGFKFKSIPVHLIRKTWILIPSGCLNGKRANFISNYSTAADLKVKRI